MMSETTSRAARWRFVTPKHPLFRALQEAMVNAPGEETGCMACGAKIGETIAEIVVCQPWGQVQPLQVGLCADCAALPQAVKLEKCAALPHAPEVEKMLNGSAITERHQVDAMSDTLDAMKAALAGTPTADELMARLRARLARVRRS